MLTVNHIGDYALIGDCHSAALVGRDGGIDWVCFPRFDSPAVLARALDPDGGCFRIAPTTAASVSRRYLEDTNVLRTRFETDGGTIEIDDCMPVAALDPRRPAAVDAYASLLRRARCVAGRVALRVTFEPRFAYGAFVPRVRATSATTIEIVGGADALWVTSSHPLSCRSEAIDTALTLTAGQELWIEAAWTTSFVEKSPTDHPDVAELARRYEETLRFWRAWIAQCRYQGDGAAAVRRAALALKAMIYAPTGAVVAAPTTSLPEQIGGGRNWDYRYTWVRDTTLTLISLLVLGFTGEADGYRQWVRRTSAGRPRDLQVMYGIDGRRFLPEIELRHLAGHRGSRPVRIGNGAVQQRQLDVYGSLMQATYVYVRAGGTLTSTNWDFLRGLADIVCESWREPDQGIWEMRDEPRHFVHSKLMCWTALDRAIAIAEARKLPCDSQRWQRERAALYRYLVEEAAAPGWFPQSAGGEAADAATLLVPAMGLLPPRHPLVLETIARVRDELEVDGLLYRYRSSDGLSGEEGCFLLCSFWLVDALIHARELAEAERILERLLALENDVGLYAEEALPGTGELLGNFPQAFTHMALVTSTAHLAAARAGELPPPDTAYDFAAVAFARLAR